MTSCIFLLDAVEMDSKKMGDEGWHKICIKRTVDGLQAANMMHSAPPLQSDAITCSLAV
jgi:hypothetical protein